jgi:hypothetical protein
MILNILVGIVTIITVFGILHGIGYCIVKILHLSDDYTPPKYVLGLALVMAVFVSGLLSCLIGKVVLEMTSWVWAK